MITGAEMRYSRVHLHVGISPVCEIINTDKLSTAPAQEIDKRALASNAWAKSFAHEITQHKENAKTRR